jgi:hypothetical protein
MASPSKARFMSMRPLMRMSWPTDSDATQPSLVLYRLTRRVPCHSVVVSLTAHHNDAT